MLWTIVLAVQAALGSPRPGEENSKTAAFPLASPGALERWDRTFGCWKSKQDCATGHNSPSKAPQAGDWGSELFSALQRPSQELPTSPVSPMQGQDVVEAKTSVTSAGEPGSAMLSLGRRML